MYPHRIRLRGPWDCEPLARLIPDTQPLPPARRMTMPCRWSEGGLGAFAGRVRFRRRFGLPRQLDAQERVWLTFEGVDGKAEVWLNRQFLGQHEGALEAFEFEVTAHLRERNELVVEVESLHGNGGLWGEAALEIRRTAFLLGIRLFTTLEGENAKLHIVGEVVGSSNGPLELYVILERSNIAYTTLLAAESGMPFQLVADELAPGVWRAASSSEPAIVRVELVQGATIWYALEQPFPPADPPGSSHEGTLPES